MPLIDLKTDLKSLKYGQDRLGGDSSQQPYITNDINDPEGVLGFDDGLIRGGAVGAARASSQDSIRIGAWLADFPKGLLWVTKQVGLQKTNPKLEVRAGLGGFASIFGQPTRIYNFGINTLAQVPANAFGTHFDRHGITPVQDDSTKYLAVAQANNQNEGANNRLVKLKKQLIDSTSPSPSSSTTSRILRGINTLLSNIGIKIPSPELAIYDYGGGPGSVYGVGRTRIRRYDDTTGVKPNKQRPQARGVINYEGALGLSNDFFGALDGQFNPFSLNAALRNDEFGQFGRPENFFLDVPQPNERATLPTPNLNVVPYKQNTPAGANGTNNSPTLRKYAELRKKIDSHATGSVFTVPDNKNTELGTTGKNDTYDAFISTYTDKTVTYNNGSSSLNFGNKTWKQLNRETRLGSGREDSINTFGILSNRDVNSLNNATIVTSIGTTQIQDLVQFRIQAINNGNIKQSDYIIFRAYITQLDDSVNATWNPTKYVGRGEEFYIYNGFTRKVSISFKVAALSAKEMAPMYAKLNFLMGNLMPSYSVNTGLMRGPFMKMTIGNYFYNQDCILNSLTYNISEETPWEVNLGDNKNTLVLPHIVDTTLTFTPIGSQTKDKNQISKKSKEITHLAQTGLYYSVNVPEPTGGIVPNQ